MDKENNLTQVTEDNLAFVEKELESTSRPLSLREITEKLAFHKTASQRVSDVFKYDPNCQYQVGDLIYKEYDEPLTVSSKTVEHFQGAVVLKVINKVFYDSFQSEMLEVDYSGGGLFRKYIDYMAKTKTQILLPSDCERKGLLSEKMEKAEDPRLSELPMTDRDVKTLEKRLRSALAKSDRFFNWNDFWQLAKNQVDIPDEKIKEAAKLIQETRLSARTEDLVNQLFGLEASHNLFEITCLSLDHALEKKHKKEFVFVSPLGWGRWHLKSILNYLLEELPLSAAPAKLPETEVTEKPQLSTFHEFPLKIYLTWREVLSGGVRVPKSLNKELSHIREYTFVDAEENKNYTVYYYPSSFIFLGLKDFFLSQNIPQGTSLTLERKGPAEFTFWLKKSKKKISVPQLNYNPVEDKLTDPGADAFTFALPNKIIFLEKETLERLLPLYEQRDDKDLHDLLVMIFKTFALGSDGHSLHFLRAYHLVDILKQTTQEDIETTLLNSAEFSASEKKKGIFHYQEPRLEVEEITPELPVEVPEARAFEPGAEALPEEEISAEEVAEEIEEAVPPIQVAPLPPKPKGEAPAAKPAKRKKPRIEGERGPRPRKSERRVIEERIELAESEQEALAAVKEREEAEVEIAAREKKVEIKPAAAKEIAFGGLFAEKLKTALKKKDKETKDEKKK
ncbi:MAG: hypothetical protein WAU81_06620 [Candidatus Aminicenantales bacterium]